MTLNEALSHITERLKFVPPGPEALATIHGHRKRSFNLSDLKTVERSYDLKTVEVKCAWCNVGDLPFTMVKPQTPGLYDDPDALIRKYSKRHKYCSPACSDSAYIYCNPQSPRAKGYVLIEMQSCACRVCGISHEDLVINKIQARIDWIKRWRRPKDTPWEVSYFTVADGTGHILQVDHITPIFKGGASVGLDNIQVICASCHQEKTASERKR